MPTPTTFQRTNNPAQLYIPCKGFICTTAKAFGNAIRNIPKTNGLCIVTKSIDEVSQDRLGRTRRTLDLRAWLLITREDRDPIRIELPFYRTEAYIGFIQAHALTLPSARISYADIQSLTESALQTVDHESQMKIRDSIFEGLNQLIESVWEEAAQGLTPPTRARARTI